MTMNTLTPRLRNSSIIGSRFTFDLNPDVKKHLTELNVLLGKPAFSVISDFGYNEMEMLSMRAASLRDEVKEAEKNSWEADNEAIRLAEAAAEAKGEAKVAEDIFTKADKNDKPLKQQLKEEWDQRKKVYDEAAANAANCRKLSAELRNIYHQKKKDEAALSDEVMKSIMKTANGKFHHHDDDDEIHFDLEDELNKPLLAKKTTSDKWDDRGILHFIYGQKDDSLLTIADCIDKVNRLSNLKNAFQQYLNTHWNALDDNQKAVLNLATYPNVSDYLLAYGYFIKGITDVNAMFNFVKTHKFGAQAVVNYAVVSTARYMIQKASLQIEEIDDKTYNDDDHPLIKKIVAGKISLHEDVFGPETEKILKNFIANDKEMDLIQIGLDKLKIDDLPENYYQPIISYMRRSSVKIDKDNISYFLPGFISQAKDTLEETVTGEEEVPIDSGELFEVEFIEDEKTVVKANVSNVYCASQLFTSLVIETELDVFNLTNFLTNNYLIRNRVDIDDKRLHQNLQQFVFSNRFTDIDSKEKMDRTDPGERQHFYRQVFNFGNGPVPQGVIVNAKFPKLWNQLVPAVKKYLEEVSSSLSEDSFVSKGGVMQIVAGLKNNLSANCTSMAKIISPIIYAEWKFITEKILGHPEIIKQVSPSVGTWKGVAETLYAEMKQRTIDASLIYDKAQICNKILREVAGYEPRTFEEPDNFIRFCGLVIELDDLTQSIAQDGLELPEEETEATAAEEEAYAAAGIPKLPAPVANGNGNPKGEWDF